MSKLELNTFLGLKEYETLNTDSVIGGRSLKVKNSKGFKDRRKKQN
jgi:hypothetical protein